MIETTPHKMRSAILASLSAIVDYLLIPVVVLWITVHVAVWGEGVFTKDRAHGFISGLFFLFLLIAFVYENGYKKYFCIGRKKYFYVVHVAPLCVAISGFVYGLWGAG